MAIFNLAVNSIDTQPTIAAKLTKNGVGDWSNALGLNSKPGAWDSAKAIGDYFHAIANGSISAKIQYSDGLTFAQGDIVFNANPGNLDTITIAGVLVTFTTGTPTGSQVAVGATLAATLQNFVTFVDNGGSSLNLAGYVSATVLNSTTIRLFAAYPGQLGNSVTVSYSCAGITSATNPLAGGAVAAGSTPPTYASCGR